MGNSYRLLRHCDMKFEQIDLARNTYNRTLQPVHTAVFRKQPGEAWSDVDFHGLPIGCPTIIGEFDFAYSSFKNSFSVKRAPHDPIQDEKSSQKACDKRVRRMFEKTCGRSSGAHSSS